MIAEGLALGLVMFVVTRPFRRFKESPRDLDARSAPSEIVEAAIAKARVASLLSARPDRRS
jgi:hypothetical protein